jgi:hypothetical protein
MAPSTTGILIEAAGTEHQIEGREQPSPHTELSRP